MGVADRLVLYGAQAKALRGVVGRLFEPAIVKHQHFGLAVFEEQFPVVGPFETAGDDLGKPRPVEPGTIDQRDGGRRHAILRILLVLRVFAHTHR
jgi:hypothetical protein